jgi:hypothetical protein
MQSMAVTIRYETEVQRLRSTARQHAFALKKGGRASVVHDWCTSGAQWRGDPGNANATVSMWLELQGVVFQWFASGGVRDGVMQT